jgi:hypothetical protein
VELLEIIWPLAALVALALAACRWGADSSDAVNSAEWDQRQAWWGPRG